MFEASQLTIEQSARTVRSTALTIPSPADMERELVDARLAESRGYFLPDEDERIRELFAHYLSSRYLLLEALDTIQLITETLNQEPEQVIQQEALWQLRLQAFVVGFSSAAILMRSATFIVDLAHEKPVVAKKLDEAECRYGIQAKSYTQVYKNLSSSRRMWRFHEAMMFYEIHSAEIHALREDPIVGELVILLEQESEFLQYRKRDYIKRKWNYRLHSFKRRHISGYRKVMFHLLKLSGSAIAEMRQPFVKPLGVGKRVTAEIQQTIQQHLQAGDIFITRHDDAMSNLFLPGFWPHAALYIGNQDQRDELGLSLSKTDGRNIANYRFLEAKKDGVLFRPIDDTLHVDAFRVLRPNLPPELMCNALQQAISHEGKLYDFMFDFEQSNRLACTALIYRAFHGVGPISFSLIQHAGRSCLSAEELIKQAIASGHFTEVADYGVEENTMRIF